MSRGRVRQAVILAGGRGRRLRPHTDHRPKPLVEVRGTPILGHQLDWFARAGVADVVVAAGHLGSAIVAYAAARGGPPRVRVLVEEQPLGRGGALKRAARGLPRPDEPWWAVYGDIWTSFPLAGMTAAHLGHGLAATVAVVRSGCERPEVVHGRERRVVRFAPPTGRRRWVNAGVYAFGPELVELLPDRGDHDAALALLAERRLLACHRVGGPWWAVNTPADLERAVREVGGTPSGGAA